MQLICIKHTPFHKNARIVCKLDENARIFLHFHENETSFLGYGYPQAKDTELTMRRY